MKIVILLTTTVNTQSNISWLKQRNSDERKKMYHNIINLWLSKTNFKIAMTETIEYTNNLIKFEQNKKKV